MPDLLILPDKLHLEPVCRNIIPGRIARILLHQDQFEVCINQYAWIVELEHGCAPRTVTKLDAIAKNNSNGEPADGSPLPGSMQHPPEPPDQLKVLPKPTQASTDSA